MRRSHRQDRAAIRVADDRWLETLIDPSTEAQTLRRIREQNVCRIWCPVVVRLLEGAGQSDRVGAPMADNSLGVCEMWL